MTMQARKNASRKTQQRAAVLVAAYAFASQSVRDMALEDADARVVLADAFAAVLAAL